MKYTPVKNNPVARFWYKGSHTHPVRRTVLIIESTDDFIKGYELREGNEVRTASESPIKTFKRSKIAKGSSLRVGSLLREKSPNKSTLTRKTIMDLVEVGA